MITLTLRTDKPEAEIGLYDGYKQLGSKKWEAHRRLVETLHAEIKSLLNEHQKAWSDVKAIVVYEGPGSFTGLRIGISVANGLAYANKIPIVGSGSVDWIQEGVDMLGRGINSMPVVPFYGSGVRTTIQKK